MEKILSLFCLLFLIFLFTSPAMAFQADIEGVCFSPDGNCDQMIIRAIDNAQEEIRVEAYSFTAKNIASALIRAKKRGIDVQVIQDSEEVGKRGSVAPYLVHAGIPVFTDTEQGGIFHDKVVIIDRTVVEQGSENFSYAGSNRNGENILIIQSWQLASYYLKDWYKHQQNDPRLTEGAAASEFRYPSRPFTKRGMQ